MKKTQKLKRRNQQGQGRSALFKKVLIAVTLLVIGFSVAAVKISLDAPASLPVDI